MRMLYERAQEVPTLYVKTLASYVHPRIEPGLLTNFTGSPGQNTA
jgi:hypothetical protein